MKKILIIGCTVLVAACASKTSAPVAKREMQPQREIASQINGTCQLFQGFPDEIRRTKGASFMYNRELATGQVATMNSGAHEIMLPTFNPQTMNQALGTVKVTHTVIKLEMLSETAKECDPKDFNPTKTVFKNQAALIQTKAEQKIFLQSDRTMTDTLQQWAICRQNEFISCGGAK
jgi:hypothetical protein